MNCVGYVFILFAIALALLTLLRLFEQVTETVDHRDWTRLSALLACPFTVWLFPARVAAGRPTAVPRHEPVRGFGSLPKTKPEPSTPASVPQTPVPVTPADDLPPPGTPAAFLVKPQVPPKKAKSATAIDPDKLAKLKQKMKEQGMLGDEE
jgi:hypothetical protein